MPHFALTTKHGPGWDPRRPIREQDGWREHAAFMDSLVDCGLIIVGGPLGNGDRTLHLVESTDEGTVRARMSEDPWAKADRLLVDTVEPWHLWLGNRP